MIGEEMAYSIDWGKFAKKLAFAAHFFLYLVGVCVYAIHETGAAPPQWSAALQIIAIVLFTLGYGLGTAWSPPRRPWTNVEREAAGLPPLPTPAPPATPVAPAPPPPVRPG